MADIVTTLQDKDGNNLYPIAGGVNGNTITSGMLQNGSVTTAKIENNAVTSDKIAGGTVTDSKIASGISPLKLNTTLEDKTITFNMPNLFNWSTNAKLLRIGHLGILMYTGGTGFTVGSGLQNIQVGYQSVGFTNILSGSLTYSQNSSPETDMKYVHFYPSMLDAYVYVPANNSIEASLLIIGELS